MCQVHTGAYVSPLVPGKTDYFEIYRLPPKKDYHVYIARSTYHYAYTTDACQLEKKNIYIYRKGKKDKRAKKRKRKAKKRQEKQEKTRQL